MGHVAAELGWEVGWQDGSLSVGIAAVFDTKEATNRARRQSSHATKPASEQLLLGLSLAACGPEC